MLSATYLASCSDDIVKIYAQLENDIIVDIARRLLKLSAITDATEYQLQILQEIGGIKQDIVKILSKYDTKALAEIQRLFDAALKKVNDNDYQYFDAAKRELSDNQKQVLLATAEKLQSQGIVTGSQKVVNDVANGGAIKVFSGLQRLTMTIATTAQNEFIKQANAAYMQVVSGAFDYQTALKHAVNNMANYGVRTVEYTDSGKKITRTIEGAVRANIMTGINQVASQVTINNCSDLGTDLVEVSAHKGARDKYSSGRPWSNHASWQGKVYCLNGERDYIDANGEKKHAYNFREVCGIGEPDGICGINCRHSYYPYFEGMKKEYDKNQLDEMKSPMVKYNNEDITQYEAEQQLRAFERMIRKWKVKANALESARIDNTYERQKIYIWQAKARDLCEQTHIRRDYSREYIGVKQGQRQPTGLKPRKDA